jgi:hypothetical protein
MEDRIGRELRRHQLALRMIAHRARRRTICDFTGLTRERVKTLRREWNVTSKGRQRGPSPTSLSAFFRSARMRSEASVIAVFCQLYDVVPKEKITRAARYFPNLGRGESLCDVYEAYRTYFPGSGVNFELVTLLAVGLAEPDSLGMRRCTSCPGVIVVDLLSVTHRQCSECERLEKDRVDQRSPHVALAVARKKMHETVIGHQEEPAADRKPDHPPKGEIRRTKKPEEQGR